MVPLTTQALEFVILDKEGGIFKKNDDVVGGGWWRCADIANIKTAVRNIRSGVSRRQGCWKSHHRSVPCWCERTATNVDATGSYALIWDRLPSAATTCQSLPATIWNVLGPTGWLLPTQRCALLMLQQMSS